MFTFEFTGENISVDKFWNKVNLLRAFQNVVFSKNTLKEHLSFQKYSIFLRADIQSCYLLQSD
jgi:hypothetical protein